LLVALGFASSTSDARRQISGRGVRIDGDVVAGNQIDLDDARGKVLQAGKRHFARLQ
jgi:tyrosyl-tRNA synthetase